jgi:hypothetical protein
MSRPCLRNQAAISRKKNPFYVDRFHVVAAAVRAWLLLGFRPQLLGVGLELFVFHILIRYRTISNNKEHYGTIIPESSFLEHFY